VIRPRKETNRLAAARRETALKFITLRLGLKLWLATVIVITVLVSFLGRITVKGGFRLEGRLFPQSRSTPGRGRA
jgi:hypothetical protein